MSEWDGLPDAWVVWSDEAGGRAVLAFRPDVFDGAAFPAACMPTVYVSQRSPGRRLRRSANPSGWHVSLSLEPEVRVGAADASFERRTEAVAEAVRVAVRFADGEYDYRGAYQVERPEYLDELDRLTG